MSECDLCGDEAVYSDFGMRLCPFHKDKLELSGGRGMNDYEKICHGAALMVEGFTGLLAPVVLQIIDLLIAAGMELIFK